MPSDQLTTEKLKDKANEAASRLTGRELFNGSAQRREESNGFEQKAWKATATGAAVVAGLVARNLLKSGYKKTAGEEPPRNPAARGTTWGAALGWAVVSGLLVGLARTLARGGAAEAWKRAQGEYPEALEDVEVADVTD